MSSRADADPDGRRERLGLLFAALCAVSGALSPAFAKLTTTPADAFFVAVATSAFGALAALALVTVRGELHRLADPRTAPRLAAVGALGTALAYSLFFAGTQRATAIEAALCLQIEPVYSLFLARVFLGHPISLRRLAAVGAILGGIALALQPSGFSGWLGIGLLLATPLGWQLSHLVVLRGLPDVAPRTLTAARYLYGGGLLVLLWLASGGLARLPASADLARLVPLLAFQGIGLYFVGTLLWYETIARLDLARATSVVVPSIPLLSFGASFLLLGEVAATRQWLGLALTATGVLAFVTAPHVRARLERIPEPNAPIAAADPREAG